AHPLEAFDETVEFPEEYERVLRPKFEQDAGPVVAEAQRRISSSVLSRLHLHQLDTLATLLRRLWTYPPLSQTEFTQYQTALRDCNRRLAQWANCRGPCERDTSIAIVELRQRLDEELVGVRQGREELLLMLARYMTHGSTGQLYAGMVSCS